MELGLYRDISNDDYHAQKGADEHFYSSSQLKDAMVDPELFKKKYITQEIERKSSPAFDTGTYVHTAILEPHLLDEECAKFTGKAKRGKEWEAFKEANEGKVIISGAQIKDAENCINALSESGVVQDLMDGGEAEGSLFWELMGLRVKIRYDWMDIDRGLMWDIKTTSGSTFDSNDIRRKVSMYSYDMSAAFYMDVMNSYLEAEGSSKRIDKFFWSFASKDQGTCRTFLADDELIKVGRAKYQKAIRTILSMNDNGWIIPDTVEVIGPTNNDLNWLKMPKETEEEEDIL